MKRFKFKKHIGLAIAMFMFMTAFSSTVNAKATVEPDPSDTISIDPRAATSLRVLVEDTDVHGANTVKVKATWRDTGNLPLKATIKVTDGAKILAQNESDITFKSNNYNLEQPVTDLYVSEDLDEMTFITGANRAAQNSSIEFEIEAPLGSRNFDITVFMGKTDGTSASNISNTVTFDQMNVISGLSVEVRDEEGTEIYDVDDYHPIYLTGMAWYKGGDAPDYSYIMTIITNKETGEVVGEYESIADIDNREFNLGPIYMPSTFDDGLYDVTVYMIHDNGTDDTWLGYSQTEFNFKKMPDIFELAIYNQFKNIRASQSFIKPYDEPAVLYDYLWVRPGTYWVANDSYHGNCNINASILFKNAKDVVSSKFYVHGSFETTTFTGQKSGNLVFANLTTFRTDAYINENGVHRRPYVDCEVTYRDGTTELIYIGEIKVALDPSGQVTDAETGDFVVGATCTLYVKDEENDGEWVKWIDETGQQTNPVITEEDGKYGWDVQPGTYDVRVYHPDYYESEDLFYSTLLDPRYGELVVPPEQTNIDIQLNKQTSSIDPKSFMSVLSDTDIIDIVPTYQKELDESIQNHTDLVIRVPEESVAFYLSKDQVQSILDAGIDLIVQQGSQNITVERTTLETYVQSIRTNICFLINDL